MEAQRNNPVPGKRAEELAIVDLAKANIGGCRIDVYLCVGGTDRIPLRVAPLRRYEVKKSFRQIEKMDGRCRGEIRGEKSEMKVRHAKSSSGKRVTKRGLVRTGPEESMMKQGHRRMKLGQNPL